MAVQEKGWIQVVESRQLAEQPVVFKQGKKQIAIFRASESVFAVDNRCPHEGYPLAKGTIDSQCQLTCNWHNWKFRLADGECVLGGDDVRAYPARDEQGFIWVDVSDPPVEITERRILKGLRIAFERREFDRICREVTRLKMSGIDPLSAVRMGIQWSFDRLEFGTTHAYAACADWLAEASRNEGDWERQLICLAETIDHMAFDALRHPTYKFADSVDTFDARQLARAIEAEDRCKAEGLVSRALDDGYHWDDLEATFVEAALAHYNDFGHSLIYVHKTRQLLEFLPDVERELSLALVRSLCYATREDLIPEFSSYAPSLDELDVAMNASSSSSGVPAECPFPATTSVALNWIIENLPGCEVEIVYDRMLEALARNMIYFDTSFGSAWEGPVNQNVGWLDFTHGITFANAVRSCCTRHSESWPRGLLQMACFVGRNHTFLDHQLNPDAWNVHDESEFLSLSREIILDHGFRDPIFSAHVLKTSLAVEEELPHASRPCRRMLLAGLNRFLNSPVKQKHVRRLARQAIDLVQRDYG